MSLTKKCIRGKYQNENRINSVTCHVEFLVEEFFLPTREAGKEQNRKFITSMIFPKLECHLSSFGLQSKTINPSRPWSHADHVSKTQIRQISKRQVLPFPYRTGKKPIMDTPSGQHTILQITLFLKVIRVLKNSANMSPADYTKLQSKPTSATYKGKGDTDIIDTPDKFTTQHVIMEDSPDNAYHPRTRTDDWKIGKCLGEGYSSRVYLAENIKTGCARAVKVVNIQRLSKLHNGALPPLQVVKRLDEEALIMSEVSHKNIVSVSETFISKERFYICMEYIVGITVLDLIPPQGMSECKAKAILWQLLDAIEHLHSLNIVHGDIKVENIIVNQDTGHATLVDFGFSRRVKTGEEVKAFGWTRIYAPPEGIRTGRISKAWDIWTCGVVFYALLTGFFPFNERKVNWTTKQVPDIVIPNHLSHDCVDILLRMLWIRPEQRLTATQAKGMPFFYLK